MANRNGRLAGAFILIALGFSTTVSAQTPTTLYARLGGTPVVTAFVADTIDRIVANPEMNRSFDASNLQRAKDLLTERICALTGGGCANRGESLLEMHAEFSALVEAMRESMRARNVPLAARNQLLEILAPVNRDVAKL